MRFFAHDGVATHGPAAIEELLKLPGFDGDTLVCPVGSDDSADWKPALTYPPFKKALLEAATASVSPLEPPGAPQAASPMLALLSVGLPPLKPAAPLISPMSPAAFPPPAAAPPPAKTSPCPRCAHANLAEARFCNACGASMSALQDISPPPAAPAPAAAPVEPPKPAPVEPPKPEAVEPPKPAPAEPPAPAPPIEPPKPPLPADPPKPAPVEPPKPSDSVDAPPFPAEEPKGEPPPFDPFARLDPMLNFPAAEPAVVPAPPTPPESGRRPLQPGKMGQLAAFEEPAVFASVAALPSEPEPAPASVPPWKRPAVLAAAAAVLLAAGGFAYMTLAKRAPARPVAELTPPPEPAPAATASPEPAPAPIPEPLYSTPVPTSSPSIPDPRAKAKRKAQKTAKAAKTPKAPKLAAAPPEKPAVAAAKPKRARKARPARGPKAAAPPAGEAAPRTTEGPQGEKDPLLEALLTDATQPEAGAAEAAPKPAPKAGPKAAKAEKAAAPKPSQFSLPGLQRPVSASDRAAAPPATNEETLNKLVDGTDEAPLAAPGAPPAAAPARKPGIEDEPAKPAEGDQFALVQVHEQFDFCSQLLAQGAYGDHYDTCLCKDAREAAPFRGRRGVYVSAKKKDASFGSLETSATILSSRIDGGVAIVKAKWSSGPGKGRDASQTWKLEDGLWCQSAAAP